MVLNTRKEALGGLFTTFVAFRNQLIAKVGIIAVDDGKDELVRLLEDAIVSRLYVVSE